ncbi:hypothetical protein RRF57_003543 [Xylaria bambusicola]|uniref:Uncharacterized protein n=1 Tax=Xylaria bambusicola TaxID=326684 RepID=A0AAN7UHN3_9PEZI
MITLRAIALLVYLILGKRYPVEVGKIRSKSSDAPQIQNAPQASSITAIGYTVASIERPDEITSIKEHTIQVTQVIEITSIEESTSQSTKSSKIKTTTNSASEAESSAKATVAKELEIQDKPEWVSSEALSSACNFRMLRITSQLLDPPYDIAGTVNLTAEWEPIADQLSEIRSLLNNHWQSLVNLHGYQEVVHFHDSLVAWVENPLKYGCSTLQHVQNTLVSLVHTSKESRGLRKALLETALQEYETDIQNHVSNEVPELRLPNWARQASELRSDKCINRNCFMRGLYPIDLIAAEIPYGVLRAVQDLQNNLNPGFWQTIKLIAQRTWRTLVWWYSQFSLLWTKELLKTAVLIVFLATGYRMWSNGYYRLELERLGVDDEPRRVTVVG